MRDKLFLAMCFVMLFGLALGASGGGGFFYLNRSVDNDSAFVTAEEKDFPIRSKRMIAMRISGFGTINYFLRLGGIFTLGYWDTEGPWKAMLSDSGGVGFGDMSIAVMPELYYQFKRINIAAGLGVGGGVFVTYIDDAFGENDGDRQFYAFLNPDMSIGYQLTEKFAVQAGIGWHLPFAGQNGKYWYYIVRLKKEHPFEPKEIGGFYFRVGVIFGKLYEKSPKPVLTERTDLK